MRLELALVIATDGADSRALTDLLASVIHRHADGGIELGDDELGCAHKLTPILKESDKDMASVRVHKVDDILVVSHTDAEWPFHVGVQFSGADWSVEAAGMVGLRCTRGGTIDAVAGWRQRCEVLALAAICGGVVDSMKVAMACV